MRLSENRITFHTRYVFVVGLLAIILTATWFWLGSGATSTTAAAANAVVVVGPITNPANGHQYYLVGPYSWSLSAEAEAVSLGGHLATINDAAEDAWVIGTFGVDAKWIGLNDRAQEGNFVWIDGDASTYRRWRNSGEPNGGTAENSVYLDGGGMVDYDCCDALYGLVEVLAQDTDGDGVPDNVDNCPGTYNPDQTDLDQDGIGDACDAVIGPPTNKDQCKNGGWQFWTRANGSHFRNQGDCVSYVNTGR